MDADGNGTVSQEELLSSARVIAEDGQRMQSVDGGMPEVTAKADELMDEAASFRANLTGLAASQVMIPLNLSGLCRRGQH